MKTIVRGVQTQLCTSGKLNCGLILACLNLLLNG